MTDPRSLTADPFGARDTFDTGSGTAYLYRLSALADEGYDIDRLPFSIRVLLEALLRECDGKAITKDDVRRLAGYDPSDPEEADIPFVPSRVLLQDFTGVPAVVDLAALRSAMQRLGGDPQEINPQVPVHLIIDRLQQLRQLCKDTAKQLNNHTEGLQTLKDKVQRLADREATFADNIDSWVDTSPSP